MLGFPIYDTGEILPSYVGDLYVPPTILVHCRKMPVILHFVYILYSIFLYFAHNIIFYIFHISLIKMQLSPKIYKFTLLWVCRFSASPSVNVNTKILLYCCIYLHLSRRMALPHGNQVVSA